ncbi:hypothetical protein JOF56_004824 [Kibdelosporangium banguiense]|uniref:Uncharacterized protein n=1 Tax=Kibdelosporangium banguiense TaxID=1365924 RepID=A0ABS4TJ52_9PSEU|nr:hypothetical protein [Kibdelosporangium banguiense]MBP2324439.1 hypothetical protein [Kibdelosporangium banguiense]
MTSWQSRLLANVFATTVRPLAAHAPLTPRTLRWARRVIDRTVAGTGRLQARTMARRLRGADVPCEL